MGMKSKGNEQIRQERDIVYKKIQERLGDSIELIDSIIGDATTDIAKNGDDAGVWYLGKSIQLLAGADLVFFVNDWGNFRGCRMERLISENYGKLCIDFECNIKK